jgi:glutathione S-transferase
MYKLYGWKLTGSLAVEAALAEAGVDFEIIPINIRADEHHTEEFGRINPRCQLPALGLPDGSVMAEGAAILQHIADAFAKFSLAPEPGTPARAQHDRWILFMAVNVYEGELRKIAPERYTDDPACAQSVKNAANTYVDRHYKLLDDAIGDGPYFFGEEFTVLDIYIWMLAQWLDQEWLSRECPKVKRLADAVADRPKIAPIHAYHFG